MSTGIAVETFIGDINILFAGRVTQLMEHLDVFISVKPKPKQPSKVSFVCVYLCNLNTRSRHSVKSLHGKYEVICHKNVSLIDAKLKLLT